MRNARPYRVRRCNQRLQMHLAVAMMQPSVANASHSCNFPQRCRGAHRAPADILQTLDFPSPKTSLFEGGGPPQRWKEFAHRAPADILPTLDFPSPKTSLLEGGGPPAGGGRSTQAVEGVKKSLFQLHMLHMHHMPDTHQAYDVFFSFFEILRPFSADTAPSRTTFPVIPLSPSP